MKQQPYQGEPLTKAELLEKYPKLEAFLNKLTGNITENQMSQLNYQIGVEGKSAEEIAREFLIREALLK